MGEQLKLLCVADIHNEFERFLGMAAEASRSAGRIDLVVIAGDLTERGLRDPAGSAGIHSFLADLCMIAPIKWIPGNHDIGIASNLNLDFPREYPLIECILSEKRIFHDRSFYGVSLSTCYPLPSLAQTWDYMTADHDHEAAVFGAIPPVDVLVSHSPPLGILDYAGSVYEKGNWIRQHIGSAELLRYIETDKPKIVVCGHVHEAAGQQMVGSTLVVNTARRVQVVEI